MPAEPSPEQSAVASTRPVSRQATVSEFDPDTGTGAVLYDNGVRGKFSGEAFRAGGLRLLRVGQRVRLDYVADGSLGNLPGTNADGTADDIHGGHVRKVTLITLP